MKQEKPRSKFKVFVDQNSPDDSRDVEEQWRSAQKKQRNKQLTIILITGAIIIGIIFAVMLNVFLKHQTKHQVLDNTDPDYTYIQTKFPHIKVLVSKQSNQYQAKMVRATGSIAPELIAWIQGNVYPSMKVLFIPYQKSGVNMIGMALGYYLNQKLNGRVDILIRKDYYRQMTIKNKKLMEQDLNRKMPIIYLQKKEEIHNNYDIAIIQDNKFHQQFSLQTLQSIIQIRKSKQDKQLIHKLYKLYNKYQIVSGTSNDQIRKYGSWYGYAIKNYQQPIKDHYKTYLFQKNNVSINFCHQEVQVFKERSGLRNLVEFVRNKTVQNLVYSVGSQETWNIMKEFKQIKNTVKVEDNINIQTQINKISPSVNNFIVVSYFQVDQLKEKPEGTMIVEVDSRAQADQVVQKYPKARSQLLIPYNNKGCFYPPRLFGYQSQEIMEPYFIVLMAK